MTEKKETVLAIPTVFLDNPFGSRNWIWRNFHWYEIHYRYWCWNYLTSNHKSLATLQRNMRWSAALTAFWKSLVLFDNGKFRVVYLFYFIQFTLKFMVSEQYISKWKIFPKYFLTEKNLALVQNLPYTGRNSCRKELSISI